MERRIKLTFEMDDALHEDDGGTFVIQAEEAVLFYPEGEEGPTEEGPWKTILQINDKGAYEGTLSFEDIQRMQRR